MVDTPRRTDPAAKARGFTLIELLATLTIVALLMGMLLPALARGRALARQAQSLSNVRQLGMGHHLYHLDHDGHLMWGYPPDVLNGVATTARGQGGTVIPALIAKRYPWRLIGYVSDVWEVVYHHTPPPHDDTYGLSIAPTYGLNSFYIGGDDTGLGYVDAPGGGPGNRRPNYGAHPIFHVEEARRPSQLITFADARQESPATAGQDVGFYRLHPPKAVIDWYAPQPAAGGALRATTSVATGVPADRYGYGAATVFLDNHAASLNNDALMDMRHWANHADHPNWNFTP